MRSFKTSSGDYVEVSEVEGDDRTLLTVGSAGLRFVSLVLRPADLVLLVAALVDESSGAFCLDDAIRAADGTAVADGRVSAVPLTTGVAVESSSSRPSRIVQRTIAKAKGMRS